MECAPPRCQDGVESLGVQAKGSGVAFEEVGRGIVIMTSNSKICIILSSICNYIIAVYIIYSMYIYISMCMYIYSI